MRLKKAGEGGFACARTLLHSGLVEQVGKARVLMANLLDTRRFPASVFGEFYHKRWRIDEAFMRLRQRRNLAHISGLSQPAVMQDVAAKIRYGRLQTLAALSAHEPAAFGMCQTRGANRNHTNARRKNLVGRGRND